MTASKQIEQSVRSVAQKLSRYRPANKGIVHQYLSSKGPKKLHLGCGPHRLDSWLNADIFCRHGVTYVDVAHRFPFPDAAFDYVYSEHTIEHLPYAGGMNMLREGLRVLRRGGKVRIATPDFAFLKGLYEPQKTEAQKRYLEWSLASWVAEESAGSPEMFVINNFFRNWGHRFIYDETTLRAAMEAAGFGGIRRYELNQSDDAIFCGLENESRMPEGFLKLETMVLEAFKPDI